LRPKLLLVDEERTRRLAAAAALADRFDVVTVTEGQDPVRSARAAHPDLGLVFVRARQPDAALRLARSLRTDVRAVPRVGVVDTRRRPFPVAQVVDVWLADGFYAGPLDADAIVGFAEAVWRGDRPVVERPSEAGPFARLIRRLRGPPVDGR
jgi:DNA-binding NarL/FixJ family response regulator